MLLFLLAVPMTMQSAVKEAVGRKLADPFSAQYEWQAVKDDALYCGFVNAKNGFGAYTGYQPFMVLYANNKSKTLVLSAEVDPDIVGPMCLKNGYRISR